MQSATLHLSRPLSATSALDAALATGLRTVYQPIVTLEDGAVVGYEALTRGPAGSDLESPLALFAAAQQAGRVVELDRACRQAAVARACAAGLRAPATLFFNAEPEALATGEPILTGRRPGDGTSPHLCIEITERALAAHPAALLAHVERLRGDGYLIAVDDVGIDERSLALLPLLRPDVIKLDLSLIHAHPSHRSGVVMAGVCAYAEATGATILAEGIECEKHLLAAQSMGATLAQGWLFGRPAAEFDPAAVTSRALALPVSPRAAVRSPVELVHARRGLRTGRKDVLLSVTRALEAQALDLGPHAVVISTFQHARHFTPATARRYAMLAQRTALTAVLGEGIGSEPARGVRGIGLGADDVLVGEWDVAVLGPHFAGALVARDLGDTGPDADRRFEFVLTFDRELVADVAAALIARI